MTCGDGSGFPCGTRQVSLRIVNRRILCESIWRLQHGRGSIFAHRKFCKRLSILESAHLVMKPVYVPITLHGTPVTSEFAVRIMCKNGLPVVGESSDRCWHDGYSGENAAVWWKRRSQLLGTGHRRQRLDSRKKAITREKVGEVPRKQFAHPRRGTAQDFTVIIQN